MEIFKSMRALHYSFINLERLCNFPCLSDAAVWYWSCVCLDVCVHASCLWVQAGPSDLLKLFAVLSFLITDNWWTCLLALLQSTSSSILSKLYVCGNLSKERKLAPFQPSLDKEIRKGEGGKETKEDRKQRNHLSHKYLHQQHQGFARATVQFANKSIVCLVTLLNEQLTSWNYWFIKHLLIRNIWDFYKKLLIGMILAT